MSDQDQQSLFNTPDLQRFVRQFAPIKVISALNSQPSTIIYFYRILPPVTATQVVFGNQIALSGYDLSAVWLSPGETLHFRPYWRLVNHPQTNYSMFIHLYPVGTGEQIAQYDGALTTPHRVTLQWDDSNELYIGPVAALTVPAGTRAGDYQLAVGIYDYSTGQRLRTSEGSDAFTVNVEIGSNVISMIRQR